MSEVQQQQQPEQFEQQLEEQQSTQETVVSEQQNGQESESMNITIEATNGTANGATNGDSVVENGTNGHSETNETTTTAAAVPAAKSTEGLQPEYYRKVFIGSLSYGTTDDTFRTYFAKYGNLLDCVIMKETKTNKSRGFGFVTYDNQTGVDELMKGRPHKLDNRELEIKRATPREESGKPGAESTTMKVCINF
jgi:RNA recognition motif-containing protein